MTKVIEETFLACTTGGHSKCYISRVIEQGPGRYQHQTQSGRIHGTLVVQADNGGLTLEQAKRAHGDIVKAKMRGSSAYQPVAAAAIGLKDETGRPDPVSALPAEAKAVVKSPMLFTGVTEEQADELITDEAYAVQRKMNGTRLQVIVKADGSVTALNKGGTATTIPTKVEEEVRAVAREGAETHLDGELIGQTYWIFDAPPPPGESDPGFLMRWTGLAWAMGRVARESPESLQITPTAFARKDRESLWAQARREGWEGVVFKQKRGLYQPGRSKEDLKCKFQHTETFVLAGVNRTPASPHGSARMEAIAPSGQRVPVGSVTLHPTIRTASGLTMRRDDVAKLIESGRTVLAEVSFLYFDVTSLHQPQMVWIRDDIDESQAVVTSIPGKEGRVVTLP